jgi:hypothetical protein
LHRRFASGHDVDVVFDDPASRSRPTSAGWWTRLCAAFDTVDVSVDALEPATVGIADAICPGLVRTPLIGDGGVGIMA